MKLALMLYAVSAITVSVHVLTMAMVGRGLGVIVEEVSLFFGHGWLKFRHRDVTYRIGWIPLGGSVRFQSNRDRPVDPERILFASDLSPPGLNDLHPLEKALVAASGCLALLLLSALCLGPLEAARSAARTYAQLIPFAPWTPAWVPSGRELAKSFLDLLRRGTFHEALGVLAAKFAVINLLPLPPFNGGMIVLTLLGWKKGPPPNIEEFATQLGMWLGLFVGAYWILMILAAR